MKILLFGGTGFIGSQLGERLTNAGYSVAVICRNQPRDPNPAIEYHVDALACMQSFEQLIASSSHVFHLASDTTPGSSQLGLNREVAGNLLPLAQLLDCLKDAPKTHLIFVSTGGAIYGNQSAALVNEQASMSPISYYGAGKAAIEIFLKAYQAQTGHGVTVLRPSNLFGPGQRASGSFGIVPTLFDCVLKQRPFELWGDGENVRDYLYSDDFIDLCTQCIDWSSGRRDFSVFNAGSQVGHSINQLRAEISEVTGTPIDIIQKPQRDVDVRRIVLDSTALRTTMGWQPSTPLRSGLELTWNWLSKNKNQ